jgi:long-chain acyl-CoA synthetase
MAQIATGPPLRVIDHLVSGPRVDDLLRRAAGDQPDRPAIRSADADLTYAELDDMSDRCAGALHAMLGPGNVVALSLTLDHWFAVAFFGTVRSGNIPALVNPLLREEALGHVVALCGATAAIIAPELRNRLPEMRTVIATSALGDLISARDPAPRLAADPGAVACLQFTSGTTGRPKAVQLTHRNLVVNAAQTAHAHRVTAASVVFDHLPTFHLMHLTLGLAAGAQVVLWPAGDEADAVDAAARYRATHFYSLPVRLSRLAAHPRLRELRMPGLTAILAGGSALPVATARALREQFRAPVVQGYGLQETSPSTHVDDLDAPLPGSCGYPLAGTECRVVDADDGTVLVGARPGEIQVRGPQVMLGYLGAAQESPVGPDGWLATGDIGYLAEDGRLFVLDRIKDVFKCDNWLVAPSEIEHVLRRHPGVADCAVVDFPDELSGAVAYGIVVPLGDEVRPAELAAFVSARLPYYQHLRHLRLAQSIPRSATGKILRRELRDQARSQPSPI